MRIVIIAQPRTGTSMLVNALNTLDDFNVYGELFARVQTMNYLANPHLQEVQDEMIKRFIRNSYDLSGKKSVDDFLDYIYKVRKYKNMDWQNDLNTGFKLLSPHLNRNEGIKIIDYINNNDIYKVILYRENKLKQAISAMTNKIEGNIHIDNVEFLMTKVKFLIREENRMDEIFANGKYVKKSYESLTGERDVKELDMHWLWNLLEYSRDPIIKVPLRKYRPNKVMDNISNFGTLASHIKNKEPQFLDWLRS